MKIKLSDVSFALLMLGSIILVHALGKNNISAVYGVLVVFAAAILQTLISSFEERLRKPDVYHITFFHKSYPDFIYSSLLVGTKLKVYNSTMTTYYMDYKWDEASEYFDNGVWILKNIEKK